jgi:HEAT repeat protein
MSEVLAELDRDEPDYSRAAQLGPEALPHLRQVVEADNPLRAAKAAYLASLIPGNDSTRLLEQAADHADPSVRVAAAHGLGNRRDAPPALVERLLDDNDPGVRKSALRAAQTARLSEVRQKVAALAENDPEEFVRRVATDTMARLTG